jgi:hypothetical protein
MDIGASVAHPLLMARRQEGTVKKNEVSSSSKPSGLISMAFLERNVAITVC